MEEEIQLKQIKESFKKHILQFHETSLFCLSKTDFKNVLTKNIEKYIYDCIRHENKAKYLENEQYKWLEENIKKRFLNRPMYYKSMEIVLKVIKQSLIYEDIIL